MKDLQNKSAEHFFLDTLHNKENAPMHKCSQWLYNYYQEIEIPEMFHSDSYKNQDDRIDHMFPDMPENAKNLLKLKAYKHRADPHKEIDDEKSSRISELEAQVEETEYREFATWDFWAP